MDILSLVTFFLKLLLGLSQGYLILVIGLLSIAMWALIIDRKRLLKDIVKKDDYLYEIIKKFLAGQISIADALTAIKNRLEALKD